MKTVTEFTDVPIISPGPIKYKVGVRKFSTELKK